MAVKRDLGQPFDVQTANGDAKAVAISGNRIGLINVATRFTSSPTSVNPSTSKRPVATVRCRAGRRVPATGRRGLPTGRR